MTRRMSMSELIDKVNTGEYQYKFVNKGSILVGLTKKSFTRKELDSSAFGYIRKSNSKSKKFERVGGMK